MLHIPTHYAISYMASNGKSVSQELDLILYFAYIFVALLVFSLDIILLCKKMWQYYYRKSSTQTISHSGKGITSTNRRSFLQNTLSASIMLAGGSFIAYGISETANMPELKDIKVPVKNLPKKDCQIQLLQESKFQ